MGGMCPAGLEVSWTREGVGTEGSGLGELGWEGTSNLCVAWKTDYKP